MTPTMSDGTHTNLEKYISRVIQRYAVSIGNGGCGYFDEYYLERARNG